MRVEIGEIFYPRKRSEWRDWLDHNHQRASEIWLRRFKKGTGKPSISYDDLVEECLCFGWIDGVVKKLDDESNVQRITPRRQKSFLSELNRQRVWKLRREGLMTSSGLTAIADQIGSPDDPLVIPEWIAAQLREDRQVWDTFAAFPWHYKRLKIGWITEAGQLRQEEMQKRLDYVIKNTRKGRMYGTIPLSDSDY